MRISIKEFLDAVDRNGLEHVIGQWFRNDGEVITAACILGQAAINLEVDNYDLMQELNILAQTDNVPGYGERLIHMNDVGYGIPTPYRDYARVARYAHLLLDPFVDREIDVIPVETDYNIRRKDGSN